jgi:hypothetical protein
LTLVSNFVYGWKTLAEFIPSDSTDIQFQLLLKSSIYIPGGDLLSSPGSRDSL